VKSGPIPSTKDHKQRTSKRRTGDDPAMIPSSMPMGERARWTYAANIALGLWLVSSPVTFGYQYPSLLWSDVASGFLVMVLGLVAVAHDPPWARWGICIVGIWLLFAPLVFWAPNSAVYASDTLIAALLIAFSILVPGMPGMQMVAGPETPPGWSYNPSSWLQRGPIIALGFLGFFISRYLAAYQLGYIHSAWDPFFGTGTEHVLTSKVSRAWPISDAGLGAVTYLLETLSGFMGGVERWRTMPWMVALFGILVIPLGAASIILVILQPVAVGTWCTLCLVTAAAMLIMIPLAVDEVFAMGQFLVRCVHEGKPFWRTFWRGGTLEEERTQMDRGSSAARPEVGDASLRDRISGMFVGMSWPWNLLLSALIGVWLMAAPGVLAIQGSAADSHHLAGALIVATAVISLSEVIRAGRLFSIVLGLWVIVAPWVISGASGGARWTDVIAGLAVVLLSLPRGENRARYGNPE